MENHINIGDQNSQQIGKKTATVNYLVIGIAVLVCFLVFSLIGYYLVKQYSQISPTPITIETDTTTNWKPYSFQGGNFKYPPSWDENPLLSRGSGFTQEIKDKDGLYTLAFETQGNYNQLTGKPFATLEEFIGPPPNILEKVAIDGEQGGRILPRAGSENKFAVVFFSKDKKDIYTIELDTGSSTLADSRVTEESVKTGQELFNQILSTFKLLDSLNDAISNTDNYDRAIQILQTIPEIQTINNAVIKAGNKTFFSPEGENGSIVTVSFRENFSDAHTSRIDTFNIDIESKVVTVEDVVSDREISLDEWRKTVKERF